MLGIAARGGTLYLQALGLELRPKSGISSLHICNSNVGRVVSATAQLESVRLIGSYGDMHPRSSQRR